MSPADSQRDAPRPALRSALWVVAILPLLSALLWRAGEAYRASLLRDHRAAVRSALEFQTRHLERTLAKVEGTLDALATFAEQEDFDDRSRGGKSFDLLARGLWANMGWVRAFELVTDDVITHVHPLEGNEKILGYDLGVDARAGIRDDLRRAIASGAPVVTGPIPLIQGGVGFVVRKSIVRVAGEPVRLAAIVFESEALAREAGLEDGSRGGPIRLAVRRDGGPVFHGSPAVLDESPVEAHIALPTGTWELAAAPIDGWDGSVWRSARWFYGAGALVVLLGCGLTFLIAHRQARLTAAVAERTAELQREHGLLEAVVEGTSDAVFVKDLRGRYHLINDAGAGLMGIAPEEVLGKDDTAAFPLETAQEIQRRDREVAESGKVQTFEEVGQLRGVVRTFQTTKGPWRDAAGRVIGVFGVARDITDQRLAEATQSALSRRMESLLQSTGEGIFGVDADGACSFMNRAAAGMLGLKPEEALGANASDLLYGKAGGEAAERLTLVLAAGRHFSAQTRFRRADGSSFDVACSAHPIREGDAVQGAVVVFTDITQQLQAERQALRSQRLEAIGTLAGGIAHDLNNALAPISMGLELLRGSCPEESDLLDTFEASSQRCANMVRRLLTFARGAEGASVLVSPHQLVDEVAGVARGTFPKNIQIECRSEEGLPNVRGDPTQLHQVLLNLCVNARDAMPEGGTLTIAAEPHATPDEGATRHPDARPGPYVILRVQDTGVGIPADVLARIGEPFFTTKGPGLGTGLGLSTTDGILRGHGGFLTVESEPGVGSTFSVHLPADQGRTDATARKPEAPSSQGRGEMGAPSFQGHGETVMFVDDEPAVRKVASVVLQRLGVVPVMASDGVDALEQATALGSELRAVITDLNMPRMDGLELVRALQAARPDLPMAAVSGRMAEDSASALRALGVGRLIDKPFDEAALAEALQDLLNPRPLS